MLRRSVRSVFKFPFKEPVHLFLWRNHFIGCLYIHGPFILGDSFQQVVQNQAKSSQVLKQKANVCNISLSPREDFPLKNK